MLHEIKTRVRSYIYSRFAKFTINFCNIGRSFGNHDVFVHFFKTCDKKKLVGKIPDLVLQKREFDTINMIFCTITSYLILTNLIS